MKKRKISDAVVRRLPRYYRYLDDLHSKGIVRISSSSLGERMGITASQIRQDLSCFGEFGQQGYGYNILELRTEIGHILGVDEQHRLVVVGAGHLGHALLRNFDFMQTGFLLDTAFDVSPTLIGTRVNNVLIRSFDEIGDYFAVCHPDVAVLTVPKKHRAGGRRAARCARRARDLELYQHRAARRQRGLHRGRPLCRQSAHAELPYLQDLRRGGGGRSQTVKRPIALLASLLAVTVLATAATAAGGDSSDPLISLNYLQTTFTTKATSSIDAALDKSDQAAYAKAEAALRSTIAAAEANVGAQRADVFTESRLKQGDILSGTTGLQVIVLAGSVNVQFSSGAVVDVTTGSEVKSGAALAENHRYLVAEDTTALFTVTGKTAVVNYCGFYSIASSSSVDYPAMAASLKTLTLFRGSDTGYGEGFDLEKAPTRMEALIMLIRLLGEESEALTCTAYQPFTDVPDWALPYAAYAYSKGYTNGVGPTTFGTTMSASAEMYTEFLLRALRYSSTAQSDISNAPERAHFAGVLTAGEVSALRASAFLRADVVYLSYYALETNVSGGSKLSDTLIARGVFSDAAYRASRAMVNSARIG